MKTIENLLISQDEIDRIYTGGINFIFIAVIA